MSAVMDADLQHDETLLPEMLALLQGGEARPRRRQPLHRRRRRRQLRQVARRRSAASRHGSPRACLRVELTDPMSGFFMIAPRPLRTMCAAAVDGKGSRSCSTYRRDRRGRCAFAELPYSFGARLHGESKLDSMVALDFLGLLLAKLTARSWCRLRFLLFAMVGGVGLVRASRAFYIALKLFDRAVSRRRRPPATLSP